MNNLEDLQNELFKNDSPLDKHEIKMLIKKYKKSRNDYFDERCIAFSRMGKIFKFLSFSLPILVLYFFYNSFSLASSIVSFIAYFSFYFLANASYEKKKYLPNLETNMKFPLDEINFITDKEFLGLQNILKLNTENKKVSKYLSEVNRDLIYAEYRILLKLMKL
jgi:hypothetical protein